MTTFQLLDDKWYQSRHLNIRDLGRLPGRKTHRYEVRLRKQGRFAGFVEWVRTGYKFEDGYVLKPRIRREAEDFCRNRMSEIRKKQKKPNSKKVRLNRIQALLKKPDGGGLDKRYAPVVQ